MALVLILGALVGRSLPMIAVILFGSMVCMVMYSIRLRLRYHERRENERARLETMEVERQSSSRQQYLVLTEREKLLLNELDARTWLDTTFTKVYARYESAFSKWLGFDVLDPVLLSLCPIGPIEGMHLKKFELGPVSPRIIRVVPTRLEDSNEVELDLDIEHVGARPNVELGVKIGMRALSPTLTLDLKSFSIEATLKLRARMSDRSPFIAVLDIAFAQQPKTFDFHLGLVTSSFDVTGLPEIGPLIVSAVQNAVYNLMVWPKRISLPLDEWNYPTSIPPTVAHGVLRCFVDCAADLPSADYDGFSDPYVVLTLGQETILKTAIKSKTLFPVWNESVVVRLKDDLAASISIKVYDFDSISENDLLGTADVPEQVIRELRQTSHRDQLPTARGIWLELRPPQKYRDRLKLKPKSKLPARVKLDLCYSALYPAKTFFTAFDDVFTHPNAAECKANVGLEPPGQAYHTSPQQPTLPPQRQRDSAAYGIKEAQLHRLYRHGNTILKAGVLRKQGFGGFRAPWNKRWFELELSLEYQAEVPHLAATLRYFRSEGPTQVSTANVNASRMRRLRRSLRDKAAVSAHKSNNDELKYRSSSNHPLGQCRLDAMDAIQLKSATVFEIHQSPGNTWRLCGDDAGAWVDALKRALQALQIASKVLEVVSGHRLSDEPTSDLVNGATMVVEVFQARGIPATDDYGFSNPYVALDLAMQSYRTRTIRFNLAPQWCECVEFWAGATDIEPSRAALQQFGGFRTADQRLSVKLFDEHVDGLRHLLGTLDIDLRDLLADHRAGTVALPEWYALESPTHFRHRHRFRHYHRHHHQRGESAGEVLLRITLRKCSLRGVAESSPRVAVGASILTSLHTITTGTNQHCRTIDESEIAGAAGVDGRNRLAGDARQERIRRSSEPPGRVTELDALLTPTWTRA